MATDALSYTGINRAYSDFAGTRACEELINLRPATEGVVPVKESLVKMSNVPYYKVFLHHTTSGLKYIAIGRNLADVYAKYLEYDEENETWVVADTLFSVGAPNPNAAKELLDKVYYASAGNILTFSICDNVNEVYENKAYTWKENAYVEMEANVPTVTFSVSDGNTIESVTRSVQNINEDMDPEELVSTVDSAINAIQENNPGMCFGTILIATALKAKDGRTFWTGNWKIYTPTSKIGTTSPPYMDATTMEPARAAYYADFFAAHDGHGYLVGMGEAGDSIKEIEVYGTNVTLNFAQLDTTHPTYPNYWNKDTSIIQSVEVYCSRPILYLDTSDPSEGLKYALGVLNSYSLLLPQRKNEDMDLGGQVLYHQASIPMESLAGGAQTVNLTFGGNVQVTEDILETDAGAIKRYGKVLSYNARFHYYDSVARIDIGMPSFIWSSSGSATASVYARYADEDQSELLYLGTISDYAGAATMVIAPSINIKEVITYYRQSATTYAVLTYRMTKSSSYNYSYCDTAPTAGTTNALPSGAVTGGITNIEKDVINVSEQYNPFVFLVEHSYKAPGNILDVQTQMAGITDSSYGRDPLNVFTERGVYALTQGSANVLYGAFLPVSNNVISRSGGGGSLPTDMGVFFLADGALWLLSGRRATLVSDALHLGPHKYIRESAGYQKISGGGSATPEYDVTNLVSAVTFEEYVRTGGRLGFNRFRMELLVSNKNYNYTYVLSLKYRQWFKIGKCLWQDDIAGDLISTPGQQGLLTILDLSTETDGNVLVHLQSRPFSMGYRYIHMHRIVSMVRARLSGTAGNKLVVALYGSDNLQDWKLLAYSKRVGKTTSTTDVPPVVTDHPLKVSQIRTTSSSRSWRYYTVCIGGIVPTDTDLGPVLVDYEPVVRRIG